MLCHLPYTISHLNNENNLENKLQTIQKNISTEKIHKFFKTEVCNRDSLAKH